MRQSAVLSITTTLLEEAGSLTYFSGVSNTNDFWGFHFQIYQLIIIILFAGKNIDYVVSQ